jgi:hypothetical protein
MRSETVFSGKLLELTKGVILFMIQWAGMKIFKGIALKPLVHPSHQVSAVLWNCKVNVPRGTLTGVSI